MLVKSRAPYGARGLKLRSIPRFFPWRGRAPYGARGLKHLVFSPWLALGGSRPVRGAWIETSFRRIIDRRAEVAPRTGRVD